MTREELVAKLKLLIALTKSHNVEYIDLSETHEEADQSLLEYIADKEISDLYNSIDKWYS